MSIDLQGGWAWRLPLSVLSAGIAGESADRALGEAKSVATTFVAGRTAESLKAAVDHAFSTSDEAVEQAKRIAPRVACKQGCAWCCYMKVEVSAPEVFRLAQHLRETMSQIELVSLVSRVRTAWHLTAKLSPSEQVLAGVPCPLLDVPTKTCIGYSFRPFSCRAWNSTDAAGCERATKRPNVVTPNNNAQTLASRSVAYGLHVGFSVVGNLDLNVYDLYGALLIALEQEDAIGRWLGGESVFAPEMTIHKAGSVPLPVIEIRL
jgi:uncharacterized protein